MTREQTEMTVRMSRGGYAIEEIAEELGLEETEVYDTLVEEGVFQE